MHPAAGVALQSTKATPLEPGMMDPCRQEGGEVAVPDGIGRDVFCRSTGRPNFSAFVSPKEEQFVLLDGSAESSTILVEDVLWLHGLHDCRSEVVTRAKLIVGMVLEGSAVKLVGA